MRRWDIRSLEVRPHQPAILSSNKEARAIVINLPAGELLQDHEVHERAWVTVLDGELEITASDGDRAVGTTGTLVEFEPRERHEVRALSDARLLLLLTPWPGSGHPGAMTPEEKSHVRQRARERAQGR